MTVPAPVSVGVVIATHNRPQLVVRALESVLEQEYAGFIDVVVVFDRSEPDRTLERSTLDRRVRVVSNTRTPGLAGARNTGITQLDTDVVAFCDDDDFWLAGKLAAQMDVFKARPDAAFVTTAMRVDYADRSTVRRAGRSVVTLQDLVRSRMSMLHSSSFAFRRAAMVGPDGFGLVSEEIPGSQGEDWDLLLRAARQHPIDHLDEPLVAVQWGATSYFIDSWRTKNDAHEWLMAHHPEMRSDPVAHATMLAKVAFGHAALGDRRAAARYAARATRMNWREPRAPLAFLAVAGVPTKWITEQLNRRGHGI